MIAGMSGNNEENRAIRLNCNTKKDDKYNSSE